MTRPPKPQPAPILPENIPDEIADRRVWVGWRYVWRQPDGKRPGKWTKPPFDPVEDRFASATDPRTWSRLDTVLAAVERGVCDGIGFCLTPDQGIVGIDFDNVIDLNNPASLPSRQVGAVVRSLASYTEWSPSGCGLRVLCRGTLPQKFIVRDWVELYDRERFLTITGQRLPGSPVAIRDAQEALDGALREIGYWTTPEPDPSLPAARTNVPDPSQRPMLVTLSDLEVLRLCRRAKNGYKFAKLYDHGDLSDHGGDHSRADAALTAMLRFYAEPDQVDRLMRTSALNRGKWEGRAKYRAATIKLSDHGERWTPPAAVARRASAVDRLNRLR